MNSEIGSLSMADHVKVFSESGLSVRKYCEANGLKEHTLRYWNSRQSKNKTNGNFKLVEKEDTSTRSVIPLMKLLLPNRTELFIYSELDPEYVRRLM